MNWDNDQSLLSLLHVSFGAVYGFCGLAISSFNALLYLFDSNFLFLFSLVSYIIPPLCYLTHFLYHPLKQNRNWCTLRYNDGGRTGLSFISCVFTYLFRWLMFFCITTIIGGILGFSFSFFFLVFSLPMHLVQTRSLVQFISKCSKRLKIIQRPRCCRATWLLFCLTPCSIIQKQSRSQRLKHVRNEMIDEDPKKDKQPCV